MFKLVGISCGKYVDVDVTIEQHQGHRYKATLTMKPYK